MIWADSTIGCCVGIGPEAEAEADSDPALCRWIKLSTRVSAVGYASVRHRLQLTG